MERNRDKSLGVTVYLGRRRGNASDLRLFAQGHAPDGAGRLRHCALHRRRPGGRPAGPRRHRARRHATATWTCFTPGPSRPMRPVPASRMACEQAAFAKPAGSITNSEGAGVSAQQSRTSSPPTCAAASAASPASSAAATPARATACRWRRSRRCPGNAQMQRDCLVQLDARAAGPGHRPRPWAATPRERALSAPEQPARSPPPNARCCSSRTLAAGLLGAFVQATSGGALYRKSTFLADSPGQDGDGAANTSTSWKTRTSCVARAVRRLTTKA